MDVSTRRSLLQSACKVAGIATAATPARWNILSAAVRKTDIRLEHVAIPTRSTNTGPPSNSAATWWTAPRC